MITATDNTIVPDSASWINGLSSFMRLSDSKIDPSLKTIISSDIYNGKIALFIPPEMADLQPENLRYLHKMASRNGYMLVEDRRSSDSKPLVEQRNLKPHKLATGIGELLKQSGMPGPAARLSTPHRLAPETTHIELPLLIDMVSATVSKSKCVVVLPSSTLVEATGNETRAISAFACNLATSEPKTVLSYFDSPGFKAIGYVSKQQFVVHVFIGGGPHRSPVIWANADTMLRNRFRFQLFRSKNPGQEDVGLLYNTFYLHLEPGNVK